MTHYLWSKEEKKHQDGDVGEDWYWKGRHRKSTIHERDCYVYEVEGNSETGGVTTSRAVSTKGKGLKVKSHGWVE